MGIPRLTPSPSNLAQSVRDKGVEPSRPSGHWFLRPACLPFHQSRMTCLVVVLFNTSFWCSVKSDTARYYFCTQKLCIVGIILFIKACQLSSNITLIQVV